MFLSAIFGILRIQQNAFSTKLSLYRKYDDVVAVAQNMLIYKTLF